MLFISHIIIIEWAAVRLKTLQFRTFQQTTSIEYTPAHTAASSIRYQSST